MKRSIPVLALSLLLLTACATASGPYPHPDDVDPVTEPTVVGAVDEAVIQGRIQGERAAETGHKVGIVAGVLAAVLGGGEHDSFDDALDRFFITHDVIATTATIVGATKGTVEGAKRGAVLDQQFAELYAIDGVEVLRPDPDDIEVYLPTDPDAGMLDAIVAVFANREARVIDLYAGHDAAFSVRDALVDRGIHAAHLGAHRDTNVDDDTVILRIRYKD